MLYICVPSYNEASTVGLLLWRLRTVMHTMAREYEILVLNDGSTDGTKDTLTSYEAVLPLTVIGGDERIGYGRALETLVRTVSEKTKYPRRDALITMQADFTDRPEDLPELVKRFEGGADIVVAEREVSPAWPRAARTLQRVAPYVTRPFVRLPQVRDPFGTLRAYRITVLRDLVKEAGDRPVITSDGWSANVELLVRASEHARRIETVSSSPRYELRPRDSRVRPWHGAFDLFKSARALRARVARA